MNITVKIREVYGRELIYPVCDNAKRFASLTGRKTFDKRDLQIIAELGYKIFVNSSGSFLTTLESELELSV